MKIKTYEEIEVWKRSHDLTLWVYKITSTFPKSETYNLVSQLRRSSSSVPANIVEGFYRNSTKELIQYLFNARGSLGETLYHLHLSKDLNYIPIMLFDVKKEEINIIGKQLNAWIKSLRSKIQ